MKMKRFIAEDMRAAIEQIRSEFGPDAVIISNRATDEGVELVAAMDYDEAALQQMQKRSSSAATKTAKQVNAAKTQASRAHKKTDSPQRTSRSTPKRSQQIDKEAYTARLDMNEAESTIPKSNIDRLAGGEDRVQWVQDPIIKGMQAELMAMRELLEHQIAGLAWQDRQTIGPQEVSLLRRLSGMGIDANLAKQLTGQVDLTGSVDSAWASVLEKLAAVTPILSEEKRQRPGVVALVGPTGVGKTTTIAKLAARFSLDHGAERVGLISTDSYRIAAHDQLRTYGRIIGVPVTVVDEHDALKAAIDEFEDRDFILVDTAGMSQRDMRLTEQLAILSEGAYDAQFYLALAANTQPWVLEEAVDVFSTLPLTAGIITKIDETASLGEVLSVIVAQNLPIAYIANGQRVPEDLRVADANHIINLALSMAQQRSHDVGDNRMALLYEHPTTQPDK